MAEKEWKNNWKGGKKQIFKTELKKENIDNNDSNKDYFSLI